jgi:hypothetical protein
MVQSAPDFSKGDDYDFSQIHRRSPSSTAAANKGTISS